MEQLTFEPLVCPVRKNPVAARLAPAVIQELVAVLAEAIAMVFRGGPKQDESSDCAEDPR